MCMSKKEITDRIATGELLTALSKENWEWKLKVVKDYHFNNYDELLQYFDDNNIRSLCPLCEIYYKNECNGCPLDLMAENCDGTESTYDKVWQCDFYDDFVIAIENMIEVLDKAVKFEMDVKNEN